MKETLVKIDNLLSRMQVSGDNVLLLAAARSALLNVYQQMGEDENAATENDC